MQITYVTNSLSGWLILDQQILYTKLMDEDWAVVQ